MTLAVHSRSFLERARRSSIWSAIAIVRRQFRTGLSGFYVFVGCIALGVMAITGVGALTDSLRAGLESQGREIIGGDIRLSRVHTRASADERAVLNNISIVSETAGMRATAARLDGTDQTLIDLKAIDGSYPLVGDVTVSIPSETTLTGREALHRAVISESGAAVEPLLLERLKLKLGDKIKIGNADVRITALVNRLPDALSERMSYGSKVVISSQTLEQLGLLGPGTLVRWRYAMALPAGSNSSIDIPRTLETLKSKLAGRGFTVTDKRNPSPEIRRALERLRQFLTLVGLTALLVGGVGVANAVASFIDKNRKTIATLKSVGATGNQIFTIYLLQVLAVAFIGIALGLCAGLFVPSAIAWFYKDALPIQLSFALSFESVAMSIIYGLLVALLFSIWPLGRTRQVRPAVLFRDEVAPNDGYPPPKIIAATLLLAAILAAVAILGSDARKLAIYFCLCVAVVFAVFMALGHLITWATGKLPRPKNIITAIALRSIAAPGGLTRSIVLSLGTGLSVLVAVALADASFRKELESAIPETSPDYFFLDIPSDDLVRVKDIIKARIPSSVVRDAPMLRGRLVSLAGRPVEEINAPDEATWVLRGDRGLTYADEIPEGSKITKGKWWPKDYNGEPLVSFAADLANQLGLKVGDSVTVNILGRDVTAKIANLRKVEWESLAINFVMVFSPNTLRGAPTNTLATVKFPTGTSLEMEADVARAVSNTFPAITQVRVKDALNAFGKIFQQVMSAVRAAGGLTLIAGALVLAGALATARQRRVRDAVILSTLGATRRRILAAHLTEYVMIALATSVIAIILGTAAAAVVLTQVMEMDLAFSWFAVAIAIALAMAAVLTFGLIGTFAALRARPATYLRAG